MAIKTRSTKTTTRRPEGKFHGAIEERAEVLRALGVLMLKLDRVGGGKHFLDLARTIRSWHDADWDAAMSKALQLVLQGDFEHHTVFEREEFPGGVFMERPVDVIVTPRKKAGAEKDLKVDNLVLETPMTLLEASRFLRVNERTLRRWCRDGKPGLPVHRTPHEYRFFASELVAWLRKDSG